MNLLQRKHSSLRDRWQVRCESLAAVVGARLLGYNSRSIKDGD